MLRIMHTQTALVLGALASAAHAQCEYQWLPGGGPVPGMSSTVYAMRSFDDGRGPALYLGGYFSAALNQPLGALARFDGTTFEPVGTLGPRDCRVLEVWNGELWAGGTRFGDGLGGVPGLARWNGFQWLPVPRGMGGAGDLLVTESLAAGRGGLVVSGISRYIFGPDSTTTLRTVAVWNNGWHSGSRLWTLENFSTPLFESCNGDVWMYNGWGAFPEDDFKPNPSYFDGTVWRSAVPDQEHVHFNPGCHTITCHDGRAVMYLDVSYNDRPPLRGVYQWENGALVPLGDDRAYRPVRLVSAGGRLLDLRDDTVNVFDPVTGWTPLPGRFSAHASGWTQLLATGEAGGRVWIGGQFARAGDAMAFNLAGVGESGYTGFPHGFDERISCLSWDGRSLFAAGYFRNTPNGPAESVAERRDGVWRALGAGLRRANGQRPLIQRLEPWRGGLIATGNFDRSGDETVPNLVMWDGARWSAIPGAPASSGTPYVLGDRLMILYSAGGAWRASLWDGSTWTTAPAWPTTLGITSAARVWRSELWHAGTTGLLHFFDGQSIRAVPVRKGTRAAGVNALSEFNGRLVVSGDFDSIDGTPVQRCAAFDGSAWREFAGGPAAPPWDRAPVEHHGSLYVIVQSSVSPSQIRRWDGLRWTQFTGPSSGIAAMVSTDDTLALGGTFVLTPGGVSTFFTELAPPPSGGVGRVETGGPVCIGGEWSARADTHGNAAWTFRWHLNGWPIPDGPTPFGSVVEGATTPDLRIIGAGADDRGWFACVVTDACGQSWSNPVTMEFCIADANCDGGIDGGDVEAFVLAWQGADPRADVNFDGGIDGSDAAAFFEAWESGDC